MARGNLANERTICDAKFHIIDEVVFTAGVPIRPGHLMQPRGVIGMTLSEELFLYHLHDVNWSTL